MLRNHGPAGLPLFFKASYTIPVRRLFQTAGHVDEPIATEVMNTRAEVLTGHQSVKRSHKKSSVHLLDLQVSSLSSQGLFHPASREDCQPVGKNLNDSQRHQAEESKNDNLITDPHLGILVNSQIAANDTHSQGDKQTSSL